MNSTNVLGELLDTRLCVDCCQPFAKTSTAPARKRRKRIRHPVRRDFGQAAQEDVKTTNVMAG